VEGPDHPLAHLSSVPTLRSILVLVVLDARKTITTIDAHLKGTTFMDYFILYGLVNMMPKTPSCTLSRAHLFLRSILCYMVDFLENALARLVDTWQGEINDYLEERVVVLIHTCKCELSPSYLVCPWRYNS
jgi:hypothetical protein